MHHIHLQVLEHVAAYLGLDPTDVKTRNFISAPQECQDEPPVPAQPPPSPALHTRPPHSTADLPQGHSPADPSAAAALQPQELDTAARPCFAGPSAGLVGAGQEAGGNAPPEAPPAVMETAEGKRFLASLFTLPRVWNQLQVRRIPVALNDPAGTLLSPASAICAPQPLVSLLPLPWPASTPLHGRLTLASAEAGAAWLADSAEPGLG